MAPSTNPLWHRTIPSSISLFPILIHIFSAVLAACSLLSHPVRAAHPNWQPRQDTPLPGRPLTSPSFSFFLPTVAPPIASFDLPAPTLDPGSRTQSSTTPTPTSPATFGFQFQELLNPPSCGILPIQWLFSSPPGTTDLPSLALFVTNVGVSEFDPTLPVFTDSISPGIAINSGLGGSQGSATDDGVGTYNWAPVNVPAGVYQLVALVDGGTSYSPLFNVTASDNVGCLASTSTPPPTVPPSSAPTPASTTPASSPTPLPVSTTSSRRMSPGAIGGIAVGVLLLLAAIAALLVFRRLRARRPRTGQGEKGWGGLASHAPPFAAARATRAGAAAHEYESSRAHHDSFGSVRALAPARRSRETPPPDEDDHASLAREKAVSTASLRLDTRALAPLPYAPSPSYGSTPSPLPSPHTPSSAGPQAAKRRTLPPSRKPVPAYAGAMEMTPSQASSAASHASGGAQGEPADPFSARPVHLLIPDLPQPASAR